MAHAEATAASAYDSADLAYFDNVLDNLVEELMTESEAPSTAERRDALRRQLGAQLFQCALAGERDFAELRKRVLASMFSGVPKPRA